MPACVQELYDSGGVADERLRTYDSPGRIVPWEASELIGLGMWRLNGALR